MNLIHGYHIFYKTPIVLAMYSSLIPSDEVQYAWKTSIQNFSDVRNNIFNYLVGSYQVIDKQT